MKSSNPAGGDLKRGGEAAAEPGPDGSVGSYLRLYAPTCILWSVALWFNVNVFMRFDLWFALLFFLLHTVPPVLLIYFPDLLDFVDRPVAPVPSRQPAVHGDDEEEEYVMVDDHDAKAMHQHNN